MQFADGAEIRGAEERHPIIALPVEVFVVLGFLHAQASEANTLRQLSRNRVRRHFEIALVVDDFPRLIAVDDAHLDGFLKKHTEMEEGHRKSVRAFRIKRVRGIELDLAPGLIVDPANDVRSGPRRRVIGLPGKFAGPLLQKLP